MQNMKDKENENKRYFDILREIALYSLTDSKPMALFYTFFFIFSDYSVSPLALSRL